MELKWQNLNIQLRNNNQKTCGRYFEVIKNSSGSVQAGQMLAVIGPSGGGKTTLMNVLSGLVPPGTITQGEVLYNEAPRDSNWGRVMGYVNQEDHVYDELTCREMIRYSGLFRQTTRCRKNSEYSKTTLLGRLFYGVFGDKKMDDYVQTVIEDLNLEPCADTRIKNLSGGERKRTMIGVELVAQPEVLFLDEPTSGLDAFTARKIMILLKKLAISRNIIVVSTIHQPSSEIFDAFDSVILLSKGLTVYSGPVDKVAEWMSSRGIQVRQGSNVPDFLLEICSLEFQRENPAEFESLKSVLYETDDIKNPSIQKRSNDQDIDLSVSLAHIVMIFMRKIRCESSEIYKFTKHALQKTAFLALLLWLSALILTEVAKLPMTREKYDPSELNLELVHVNFRNLYYILISAPFTMVQVTDVAAVYIYQVLPIKKELFVKAYSSTSFYWGMFLYSYLTQVFLLILPIALSRYFFPKMMTLGIIYTIPLLVLGNTILGVFIASLSTSKKLNRFYSFLLSALGSIPPNCIALILMMATESYPEKKFTLFKCATCLFFFFPTALLNMLVTMVPFYRDFDDKNISSERLFRADLTSTIESHKKTAYSIFFLKKMTTFQIKSLTVLSCCTIIILSLMLINNTLRSPVRYKLQSTKR